ncbi:hypothetical protein LJC63_07465 [Ruminococcaceae bacterium OttesenSCG-928-L11]|nr:hypothetical protein [Ruminococcaceae bacterium OttesenSCG-928-L11]
MEKLGTYAEFVDYVTAAGVVAMTKELVAGFPTLKSLTTEEQWHTDTPETDPWQWKNRAAVEKKLAFGCLLNGQKGFIARDLYSSFYVARRPRYTLRERFEEGTLGRLPLDMYELFQPGVELGTFEIRQRLNVSAKNGGAKADAAIVQLQKEFYITVCGTKRKRNKNGEEYGWGANSYCRVEDWNPEWLTGAEEMEREEAVETILSRCGSWNRGLDLQKLEKALFG